MTEEKTLQEKIQEANETIKTIGISRTDKQTGLTTTKQYAEVNQRIKAFRKVYPDGTIETEMIKNENGSCIFRAIVKATKWIMEDGTIDKDQIILATATAHEKENSSFINKTSYIENCETSAVGRALGLAGFGIDAAVASAEEVIQAEAQEQQSETNKKEKDEILKENMLLLAEFSKLVIETQTDTDAVYAYYKVTNNTQMTNEQLKEANLQMKKKMEQK